MGDIVAELAGDLVDNDAGAAVVALDSRQEEAEKLDQRHKELTIAVAERKKQIECLPQ